MSAKKIIVASSKGGVGKTTVSLGISGALVALGKKVLLCDLDFENRCLDLYLGLQDTALFSITDVAFGTVPPDKAVIKNNAGLSFISAPSNIRLGEERSGGTVTPEMLVYAINEVVESVGPDFVVFDTSAGRQMPEVLAKAYPAAMAVIVASHTLSSRRAAEATAARLEYAGLEQTRLVICGYETKPVLRKGCAGVIEIIDSSKVRLLGVVPYDRELMMSHEKGVKAPKDCFAAIAFENIAARICGKNVRLFDRIPVKRSKII